MRVRSSGRGKTSHLELGEMEDKGPSCSQLRDAKATRVAAYWDRPNAFAELGLAADSFAD